MNNTLKLLAGLLIAAIFGLALAVLFRPIVVNIQTGSSILGAEGDTNFTNLVLSGYATVGNVLTVTAGGLTVTAGGLIVTDGEVNVENLVQGDSDGSALSITTVTSTLTAAQVCDNSLITYAPAATGASSTLPHATSTVADCLTQDGDWRMFTIRNSSTTGTLLIVTSTGDLLYVPTTATSTSGKDATINAGNYAEVKMLRVDSTTVQFVINESITL